MGLVRLAWQSFAAEHYKDSVGLLRLREVVAARAANETNGGTE